MLHSEFHSIAVYICLWYPHTIICSFLQQLQAYNQIFLFIYWDRFFTFICRLNYYFLNRIPFFKCYSFIARLIAFDRHRSSVWSSSSTHFTKKLISEYPAKGELFYFCFRLVKVFNTSSSGASFSFVGIYFQSEFIKDSYTKKIKHGN